MGCSPETPGQSYLLRTAKEEELEAVFRFRYEHFFRCFSDGYPGLDRKHERLFEPHDPGSTHYCAFDAEGRLCAVSTATAASTPGIPAAWNDYFKLDRFAPFGLDKVVVSTRLVIHPDHRTGSLFTLFYRFILEGYLRDGFDCAVHFCSAGFISRYEHLGHLFYAEPFTLLPTGLLRVPMLIDLNDSAYLRRVGSPIAEPASARGKTVSLKPAFSELGVRSAFSLLSPGDRLAYIRTRLGALPEPAKIEPLLELASPLYIKAGLSHAAPASENFLCVLLSGAIQAEEGKTERTVLPGDFIGAVSLCDPASLPPAFTARENSEILVFDQRLTKPAFKAAPYPEGSSPWGILHRTFDQRAVRQHLPAM